MGNKREISKNEGMQWYIADDEYRELVALKRHVIKFPDVLRNFSFRFNSLKKNLLFNSCWHLTVEKVMTPFECQTLIDV